MNGGMARKQEAGAERIRISGLRVQMGSRCAGIWIHVSGPQNTFDLIRINKSFLACG